MHIMKKTVLIIQQVALQTLYLNYGTSYSDK